MGSRLRERGFKKKVPMEFWAHRWQERRVAHIAGEGAILEVTYRNEYMRIIASSLAPDPAKPYAFYWVVSFENPEKPKTDFYRSSAEAEYLSEEQVTAIIETIGAGAIGW